MKKLFKRIAVLICIVTLFASPVYYTSAATPFNPVVSIDLPNIKCFDLVPHYELEAGKTVFLDDATNSGPISGYYYVPAGNSAAFSINCSPFTPLKVEVYRVSYGLMYETTITNGSTFIVLPPQATDGHYIMRVSAIGTETVKIENYCFQYFN